MCALRAQAGIWQLSDIHNVQNYNTGRAEQESFIYFRKLQYNFVKINEEDLKWNYKLLYKLNERDHVNLNLTIGKWIDNLSAYDLRIKIFRRDHLFTHFQRIIRI